LDHKKCIACSLCSLACPNQAIKLKIVPDVKKKRHMQSYVHLVGRCLYCNLCVEACNMHALSWDKNYAISSWHEEDMDDELVTAEGLAYFHKVMEKAKAEAEAEAKAKAEEERKAGGGDA
ncbi:MAG: 4Fe-4S dicluster domain-containing protein, partial [Schwartzia sp.]|nr:4Fe-4S dicluster domain-containing protein [Schwartzia sp. (in: firmicutes)]